MRLAALSLLYSCLCYAGYSYVASVSIPAPTSGPHVNFTVAIKGTDLKMATVANGGKVQNTITRVGMTVPADLVVSTDAAANSLISWGFEKYVPTTGELIIWAKISSYSASTTLYVSVGNAAVSTYQGGAQGSEFDSYTGLVVHLPDGTTLSGKDFSANSTDFTPTGITATTGIVDGAASDSGSGSNNLVTSPVTISTTPMVMTFSAWVYLSTPMVSRYTIFTTTPNNTANNWSVEFNGLNGVTLNSMNVIAPGSFIVATPANSVTNGQWYHVAFSRNGTGQTFTLYLNGVSQTPTYLSVVDFIDSGQTKAIGNRGTSGQQWVGTIDEVVYSKTVRSAGWIATMYANQSSPPTIGVFSPVGAGSQSIVF